MKSYHFPVLGAVLVLLTACGGKTEKGTSLVSAKIISFATEECYCCPGVTIEVDGEQYLVEEFPNFGLKADDLPRSVVVELSEYKGTCQNKDRSVTYLEQ